MAFLNQESHEWNKKEKNKRKAVGLNFYLINHPCFGKKIKKQTINITLLTYYKVSTTNAGNSPMIININDSQTLLKEKTEKNTIFNLNLNQDSCT